MLSFHYFSLFWYKTVNRIHFQRSSLDSIDRAQNNYFLYSLLIGDPRKSPFRAYFSTKWAGKCLILSVITGTNRDMIIETSQVSLCWARGRTFTADIKTANLANNFFNFRRGLKMVLPLTPHPLKIIKKFQCYILPDSPPIIFVWSKTVFFGTLVCVCIWVQCRLKVNEQNFKRF